MTLYDSLADDMYMNVNLATEMELPGHRETVLHFFECVRKKYPTMRKFHARDKRDFVLEEDKEQGRYRWVAVEPRRFCSGHVNPQSIEEGLEQHRFLLDLAPALLSMSPLDCEAIDVLFGFDFAFRGNHNSLLAEALGPGPALEGVGDVPGSKLFLAVLMQLMKVRTQVRVSTETRTNAFQVRTESLATTCVRHSSSVRKLDTETYVDVVERLAQLAQDVIESCVVEQILRPLARTISLK